MPEEIVHNTEDGNTAQNQPTNNVNEEDSAAKAFQEKTARTIAYFNDMDNPEYDDIEKDILATGTSIPDFKKDFVESIDAMGGGEGESIMGMMPTDKNYSNVYDFKNSVWDDFATSFQGGLNRAAYGLGAVVPGIAAATQESGESPEWTTDWIEGMGDWHDATKERTSDASKQSFFETGSARAFASGMGSGLASMAPMALNFIPYVGSAAYLTTTFSDVFGTILENGQENVLSVENSSRMALALAIPITVL